MIWVYSQFVGTNNMRISQKVGGVKFKTNFKDFKPILSLGNLLHFLLNESHWKEQLATF